MQHLLCNSILLTDDIFTKTFEKEYVILFNIFRLS